MPRTDKPDAAAFGQWRSELAQMKDVDGTPLWKGNTIRDAVGQNVNGRNWGQIAQELNNYMNNAPVGN